ncbi:MULTISPECIES: hypothetical protein [unclassified Frankia]
MSGKPQQPPRATGDSHLDALLARRYKDYEQHYKRYGVSLGAIAHELAPDGAGRDEHRNLAARIGRFYLTGTGRSAARWAYFETELRLWFSAAKTPAAERKTILDEYAALYRRAFPHATDGPYGARADTDVSFEQHVQSIMAGFTRLLGTKSMPSELSGEELRRIAGDLIPLLDNKSMFNPCLALSMEMTRRPFDEQSRAAAEAITTCDERLAEIDQALCGIGGHGVRRLRRAIAEHRTEHRRMLMLPPIADGAFPDLARTDGVHPPAGTGSPLSAGSAGGRPATGTGCDGEPDVTMACR